MPVLDVRLLGPPRFRLDGRSISIKSHKAMGLFCYLAAARQVHARDRLAGMLWPEVPERNALASLRTALYDIRSALDPHDAEFLLVDRTRIGVPADAEVVVDAAAVDAVAVPGDPSRDEFEMLQAAVDAYSGPFMDGVSLSDAGDFEDWVFLERERLDSLYLNALCRLGERHAAAGRHTKAIEMARRVLAADPLREDVHRSLMRFLAVSGQRAAALEQFDACRRSLEDELGVAPLASTTELAEHIRAGRPFAEDETGPGPISRAAATRVAVVLASAPTSLDAESSMVGRSRELEQVLDAWTRSVAGHRSLVLVQGEAGIGKSRLVAELVSRVAPDATVLVGRCHEASSTQPYAPIVDALRRALPTVDLDSLGISAVWLREIARLLPELGESMSIGAGTPLDGVRDRDRLFEGMRAFVEALAVERPVLLVVEDIHWSDETSLSLLDYIARGGGSRPVAVVVTLRGEDLSSARRDAVRSLAKCGRTVPVGPLSEAHTADLIASLSESGEPPARFSKRLHRSTGGNPFFLVETLRAMFEQGSIQAGESSWTTSAPLVAHDYVSMPVPESVELVVAARLDRLTDDARRLLDSAAATRRDFEFDTIQAASGLPPTAALDSLDELLRQGLVREVVDDDGASAPRYDFAHALVRDYVYGALSAARRQYLHRRLAGLLESATPVAPDRVAYHYLRGGVRDRACAWSLHAGDAALGVYAAEGALVHFRTARELAVDHSEELAALVGIGDAFVGLGRPGEAIRSFEAAQKLAADPEDRAELARRIGRAHERQGAYDLALNAYGDARKALHGRPLSLASIRIADGLATVYVRLGRFDDATELCQDGLRWLGAHPDLDGAREAEAWLSNTLGMARMHAGSYVEAEASLHASLLLKQSLGDRLGEATLLNNLGVVSYHRGDDEAARRHYCDSLEIKTSIGDGYGRAIALTNLALIETHLEDYDSAAEHLAAAGDVAGDVGAAWLMPEIRRVSAQRALALGDGAAALDAALGSLAAAEELGVPAFIGVAHRVLGQVKAVLDGEQEFAWEHFETSLAVFEMLANEHELAKTHAVYGEVLVALGRPTDAEPHLHSAAEVFTRSGAHGRLQRLEPLLGT